MDGFEDHIFKNAKSQKFQIRRARLSDVPGLVSLLQIVWFDSPFSIFQNPYRHKYPEDMLQRFYLVSRNLLFDTRQVSLVAVPLSDDGTCQNIAAYARFLREGDDPAARRLISAQWSLWNTLLGWYFSFETKFLNCFWPDRSLDRDAQKKGRKAREQSSWKYWREPEMKARYGNRWHVTNLLVSTDWQRQGLGHHLMQMVLNQAEKEHVIVGLESTVDGEKLYSGLGFQVRGRSEVAPGGYQEAYMAWTPQKAG